MSRALPLQAPKPTIPFLVSVSAVGLFAILAAAICVPTPVVEWDWVIVAWMARHDSARLREVMTLVSAMHSSGAVAGYCSAMAVCLFVARDRFWAWVALLGIPCGMLLNLLLKHLFLRPRPGFADAHETLTTYSFPSGHTMAATMLYGLVVCLLLRERPSGMRSVAMTLCAAAIALVGLSRICLGVHYLSDVVGAVLEGTALLASLLVWQRRRTLAAQKPGLDGRERLYLTFARLRRWLALDF